MFGTMLPRTSCCTPDQRKEYKKYYCGLCFALGEEFGKTWRLLLNYDLTNEFLLAACGEGFSREEKIAVCPWSWKRKKVTYIKVDGLSQYMAQLTYLLAYYKAHDDVSDDGSMFSRFLSKKIEKKLVYVDASLAREKLVLEDYLNRLHEIEKKSERISVFNVAELFGSALENMVKISGMNPEQAQVFGKINYWTGIWIYTADAIDDCLTDALKKRYNPILAGCADPALDVLRSRKDELLGILKVCRQNLIDLADLYTTGEDRVFLHNLFSQRMPGMTYLYLGVDKNVLES